MFLKNFRIKSNTAIRGSDRRKLRTDVMREFPHISQETISDVIPNKEDMSVMKITTHSGQNVTAYMLNGSPIFFQVETKLYPTVYLLWKYPVMLPTFTTWPNVFEKIHGGADLMLPGVILPNNSLDNLMEIGKGEVCSVTLLGNRAPVAVGYTAVSSGEAREQGMRGKAVIILHSYLDQLWSQGIKSDIPLLGPLSDLNPEQACEQSKIVNHTVLDNDNKTNTPDNIDENYLTPNTSRENEHGELNNKKIEINLSDYSCALRDKIDDSEGACALSPKEVNMEDMSLKDEQITTEEVATTNNFTETDTLENQHMLSLSELMDKLLERCFMHGLLNTKNSELPMLTSTFYKNFLLSCCPPDQTLDIKKSSYKKLTRFLEIMDNNGFLKVKEQSKGVHSIESINYEHRGLKKFKKENKSLLQEKPYIPKELSEDNKFHPPEIEELLAVSGATQHLFKLCGYSKGSVLSAKDVRQIITDYIKSQELISPRNKRMVLLNPVLFSVVHNKNEGNIDCLSWDEVFKRIIDRMNPCHKVTCSGQPPITRKGKLESIEIKVEQRMGNKKVTLVHNLEYYGIDPEEFAHKLQLKAASSTAVSQLPGKSNPGQQVMVQGNQIQHVANTLQDDYHIVSKYINGLDKLKQSGRKKK